MNRHYQYQKLGAVLLLLVADIVYFGLVNPANSNSLVVFIGCILIIFTIYILIYGLIKLLAVFFPISRSTQRRLTIFITLLLAFLLLMQSIGQLSLKDILAMVPLMIVLYLYLTYITKSKTRAN